jgi:hypothetical protein
MNPTMVPGLVHLTATTNTTMGKAGMLRLPHMMEVLATGTGGAPIRMCCYFPRVGFFGVFHGKLYGTRTTTQLRVFTIDELPNVND